MSPRHSWGTCKRAMMPSSARKTTILSATLTRAIKPKESTMLRRSSASCRRPQQMEKRTPLPMQSPRRIEVRKVMSV